MKALNWLSRALLGGTIAVMVFTGFQMHSLKKQADEGRELKALIVYCNHAPPRDFEGCMDAGLDRLLEKSDR